MPVLKRSSVDVEAVIRVHAAQGFGSCSNADQALVTLGAEVERLREALTAARDIFRREGYNAQADACHHVLREVDHG
jgi:hypothetical protein